MGSVYESGWEDTVREGVDKQHSSNMLSLSLLLLLLHIMLSQNRIKLIIKYKYNLGLFAKRQGLVSVRDNLNGRSTTNFIQKWD